MRKTFAVTGILLSLAVAAHGQTAPESVPAAKPKIYALVAAVGEQFSILFPPKNSSFSRIRSGNPYTLKISGNQLNRSVLGSMDRAIITRDPGAKRIYLALPGDSMDSVKPFDRENLAIGQVVGVLEKMPERVEWETIIVATPAYKWSEDSGIEGRMAGFGVYFEPRTKDPSGVLMQPDLGQNGQDATTPEGKYIRTQTFTAPLSFIDIWVLDPKTLMVLDKQTRLDNSKLFDPFAGGNITQNISKAVLMKSFTKLLDQSVTAAIAQSDVLKRHGVVSVGDVKEAAPQDAQK